MKRFALVVVVAVLVGHVLGVLISKDPGYVLLSYSGHTLSMSLWVFLLILVATMATITFLYRSLRSAVAVRERMSSWFASRALNKGLIHTNRGLLYLQQGDLARAARFLESGLRQDHLSAVNYIGLAQIADR